MIASCPSLPNLSAGKNCLSLFDRWIARVPAVLSRVRQSDSPPRWTLSTLWGLPVAGTLLPGCLFQGIDCVILIGD